MTRLDSLRQRLLQFVHDPVVKPLLMGAGVSQAKAGREIATLLASQEIRYFRGDADHLATGADRPSFGATTRVPAGWKPMRVDWRQHPIVTHPLQRATVRVPFDGMPVSAGARSRARELLELTSLRLEDVLEAPGPQPRWDDERALYRAGVSMWRDFPEQARLAGLGALWLPADSRAPDHSVEDHTRVAAAAAFVGKNRDPWMVALTIGGVQDFITQSRTTRDLWTASMIFAELAWAGMRKIVDERGPEAILYPDLRGNPFADQWMLEQGIPGVPAALGDARTHAAMLPNTFVALVPDPPGPLLEACRGAVRARWLELGGAVRDWLARTIGPGNWSAVWRRQVDDREWPAVHISAVRWKRRMEGLGAIPDFPFLPGQAEPDEVNDPVLAARSAALRPWVSDTVWAHYELAQRVYWATDSASGAKFLTSERGFDYALVHAQLRTALASSKAAATPIPRAEPGEKCTVTGVDQAVTNDDRGNMGPQRDAARAFWKHPKLDPEGSGAERLGAPAAVKRFLAKAGDPAFHRRHAGEDPLSSRPVPFPSTSAIAAQPFLVALAGRFHGDPKLRAAVDRVLAELQRSGLPRETGAPDAQPRLERHLGVSPALDAFLRMEPGYLHASSLDIYGRRNGMNVQGLQEAVGALGGVKGLPKLGTRLAVVKADGDSIGRLVAGDPEVIRATWRDVLHPEVVREIDKGWGAGIPWIGFLGSGRHLGPGVHAAISRALATFAHQLVGWVVEREFSGRLVYAGGDDLLALFPASDALPAVARLQQLFSAPFVVDTQRTRPWVWRTGDANSASADGSRERERYRIPDLREGSLDLEQPWREEGHCAEPGGGLGPPLDAESDMFAMLGRHSSLSAGVVLAHHKTPLRSMLNEADRLLEHHAKTRPDREDQSKARVAVSWMSRSGEKLAFVGRWNEGGLGAPTVQRHLRRILDRYLDGGLANRAPYLLRDALLRVDVGNLEQDVLGLDRARLNAQGTEHGKLLRGLLRSTCFGDERGVRDPATRSEREQDLESAMFLVSEGIAEARRGAPARPLWSQTVVAGLLLARHLAAEEGHDA